MNDGFGVLVGSVILMWCIGCGILGFYMMVFNYDATGAAFGGYIKKHEECVKQNALKNGQKCEFIAVVKEG